MKCECANVLAFAHAQKYNMVGNKLCVRKYNMVGNKLRMLKYNMVGNKLRMRKYNMVGNKLCMCKCASYNSCSNIIW
jgi:hypothetical protein